MQKKGLERLQLCAQRRHPALSRRRAPPPLRRRSAELDPAGIRLLSESGRTVGARAARLHHAARATYRTVSRWRPWGSCAHALVSPGETPPAQQWTLGARGVGTAPSAGSPPSFPGGRRSVRSGMSLLVTGAPTNGAAGPPPCVSAASSAAHGRTALDQCAYLQGRSGFPSSDTSRPPCARRCRPRTLSASAIYGDTLLPCTPPPKSVVGCLILGYNTKLHYSSTTSYS